jgi:hypothetical protein
MNRQGKEHYEDLGVDGRLIGCTLKVAVKIWYMEFWI